MGGDKWEGSCTALDTFEGVPYVFVHTKLAFLFCHSYKRELSLVHKDNSDLYDQ